MRLVVAILHYMFDDITYRCLDSCYRFVPPSEVLVVDNGSPVPFAKRPADEEIYVQYRDRGSFASGFNSCARAGAERAEFVLVLNNDTLMTSVTLPHLVAVMEDPRVGIAVPMYSEEGSDSKLYLPTGFGWDDPEAEAKLQSLMSSRAGLAPTLVRDCDITAWLCRTAMLQEIGYLDEGRWTGHSWGCPDYSHTAADKGWDTVVVPTSFIWHEGAATYGRLEGGRGEYRRIAQEEYLANARR